MRLIYEWEQSSKPSRGAAKTRDVVNVSLAQVRSPAGFVRRFHGGGNDDWRQSYGGCKATKGSGADGSVLWRAAAMARKERQKHIVSLPLGRHAVLYAAVNTRFATVV